MGSCKMETFTKIIVTENGEEVVPLTTAEIAQRVKDIADGDARRVAELSAEQSVADARASRDAKLAKMGFTAAEIENW